MGESTKYPNEPKPIQSFRANYDSVRQLMRFDEDLLVVITQAIRTVADNQARSNSEGRLVPPAWDVRPVLTLVENVRKHESLGFQYGSMLNQCLVLLVSHFTSAVRELFIFDLDRCLRSVSIPDSLWRLKLELDVNALVDMILSDGMLGLAVHLASDRAISFQDMQSIARAFESHFGYSPPRDAVTNDIIVAHAARHIIVHNSARVDDKMLKQVQHAIPRNLKPSIPRREQIAFTEAELTLVGDNMIDYLHRTHEGVMSANDQIVGNSKSSDP